MKRLPATTVCYLGEFWISLGFGVAFTISAVDFVRFDPVVWFGIFAAVSMVLGLAASQLLVRRFERVGQARSARSSRSGRPSSRAGRCSRRRSPSTPARSATAGPLVLYAQH